MRLIYTLFETNLARPAAAQEQPGGLYVLLLFLIFHIYLFLAIHIRPIISTSTGPIFANFLRLVELWL